jgi:hypothetical protein
LSIAAAHAGTPLGLKMVRASVAADGGLFRRSSTLGAVAKCDRFFLVKETAQNAAPMSLNPWTDAEMIGKKIGSFVYSTE